MASPVRRTIAVARSLAFLTPQSLGSSSQLGGVHHHAADGGNQLRIVVDDVLTLCAERSRR
jgi:hypothetical protein